ncbi:hypothetical protein CTZ28_09605 [Streptomyces shenzhenensis]|uniref:Uncharacterized protein n=1 Tax=Streptomyces shenzhenensis TaxID=943815 RepID=A0A3M0IDV3_9ACTN|nr:hypothetical protein CTZ28_09605 [Streptomyces shenzhenensis]
MGGEGVGPAGMPARPRVRGLRVCVRINPYIAQRSPLFAEGRALGHLLKRPDGGVRQWDLWVAEAGVAAAGGGMGRGAGCGRRRAGRCVGVGGVRWAGWWRAGAEDGRGGAARECNLRSCSGAWTVRLPAP